MALRDDWQDLQDAVAGVIGSGSDLTVAPINKIAHAVIDLEEEVEQYNLRMASVEDSVESLSLVTDEETTPFATKEEVDIKIQSYIDEAILGGAW